MGKVLTIKLKEDLDIIRPKLQKVAKKRKCKSINALLNETINQLIYGN